MASDKGPEFERKISRLFSLWWSTEEADDIFWRNRVRVTSKTPSKERQLGDTTAIRGEGIPFSETICLECKTGYSKTKKGTKVKNVPWDLLDFIDSKDQGRILREFWHQTKTAADIAKKLPLLVFKRDFHKECWCTDKPTVILLERYCGKNKNRPLIHLDIGSQVLYLGSLQSFFDWVSPKTIIELWKDRKDYDF
jgi:hypothetical protein